MILLLEYSRRKYTETAPDQDHPLAVSYWNFLMNPCVRLLVCWLVCRMVSQYVLIWKRAESFTYMLLSEHYLRFRVFWKGCLF